MDWGKGRAWLGCDKFVSRYYDYYCCCLFSSLPTVVLVGIVRRTGTTSSGLRTIRLRVDKVLRGDADGISHHSSVEVRIFTGTNDISRLHRGQKVILSGVSRGKIVYMFNSPVEDYSSSLEKAIVDC